jgi:hypothetical protein
MLGSGGETDKNHDCSEDWIAEQLEGFQREMWASFQKASRCRQRMLGGDCSLAVASQAWGKMGRKFQGFAYDAQRILWRHCECRDLGK